jgi:small subunit ribosomal protein S13
MRIAGVNIPEEKRLEIGLTAVYGVGRPMAKKILSTLKVDLGARPKDLSTEQENAIRTAVESRSIEGNLRREISANIKRLKEIKAWRGDRHAKKLPVHGQTTRTNNRTIRGNVRKTMTSGRRKLEKT